MLAAPKVHYAFFLPFESPDPVVRLDVPLGLGFGTRGEVDESLERLRSAELLSGEAYFLLNRVLCPMVGVGVLGGDGDGRRAGVTGETLGEEYITLGRDGCRKCQPYL